MCTIPAPVLRDGHVQRHGLRLVQQLHQGLAQRLRLQKRLQQQHARLPAHSQSAPSERTVKSAPSETQRRPRRQKRQLLTFALRRRRPFAPRRCGDVLCVRNLFDFGHGGRRAQQRLRPFVANFLCEDESHHGDGDLWRARDGQDVRRLFARQKRRLLAKHDAGNFEAFATATRPTFCTSCASRLLRGFCGSTTATPTATATDFCGETLRDFRRLFWPRRRTRNRLRVSGYVTTDSANIFVPLRGGDLLYDDGYAAHPT